MFKTATSISIEPFRITLSIAGFDGSGGAGLQADLKTFSAFGCYGMTVLTALPIQNTCGVRNCYSIPLQSIQEQLEAIFDDIVPHAIKIGMLYSSEIIHLVADFLQKHATHIPIVLDPVMIAKSGNALLLPSAIEVFKTKLIPLATILTPNLPEAHTLIGSSHDMEDLATQLLSLGPQAILLKGGHNNGQESNDFFLDKNNQKIWLKNERINTNNTHGTGCTLSAAICSCLALGFSMSKACSIAKRYTFAALTAAKSNSVGKGHGPVHHFYHIWPNINFDEVFS